MIKIIRSSTVPQSLNTFCYGFLKKLTEKYEVVALSSPGIALDIMEKREGVRSVAIPIDRHISIFNDFVSLFRLILFFRKERPTMVHSITPKAGLLCMIAAWITRVPVRIHTFTGLVFPTSQGMKKKVLMMTDKITCVCATHIIPEGEGVKRDLLENGITKKNLQVLGYGNVRGVDMVFYSRRPEVMKVAETIKEAKIFTFLYVGRIVRDKGINELVSAFIKLYYGNPRIRLILVGAFEDSLDPISAVTRKTIDSHPSIFAVGVKRGDDLLAYYAASDCFILPSYREGFPNTVLEAGAMGLPSIVTDINGSNEIIMEGENGFIIPSQDTNALYHSMEKMLLDQDSRQKMASKARGMVGERYEQSYVHQCLTDFYEEILAPFK